MEHGANINKKNDNGKTALHYAIQKGYGDIVKYLVRHRSNLKK